VSKFKQKIIWPPPPPEFVEIHSEKKLFEIAFIFTKSFGSL